MTQSVAQKTSISERSWRRQTNSPSWWIAFSCGSIILHVLALWLISLYSLYTHNSSLKGRSQSAVAIEFIEISPQKSSPGKPLPKSQPKPKPVSPKPKPISQNSQPTNLSTVVKPPISNNDPDAIAFNNQKIQEQFEKQQKQLELAQRQRQLQAQQRQLEALQRQQEAEQQRILAEQLRQRVAQQEQLEAQLRQREAEQQRQLEAQLRQQEQLQQELEQRLRQREAQQRLQQQRLRQQEAQQRQLEQAQRQREAQEQQRLLAEKLRQEEQQQEQQRLLAEKLRQSQLNQQQNQNPADGEQITDAIQNKLGQTPQQRQVPSQTPIKETQLNQSGGILTANWDVADKPIKKGIPTNPPKPKQNISQNFVIPATDANNLESANFQVYLMINESGTVEFTRVDENIPVEKRQLYQNYVDKQLLNKKLFIPATDLDPTTGELKPRRGELYIRIKIQRGY